MGRIEDIVIDRVRLNDPTKEINFDEVLDVKRKDQEKQENTNEKLHEQQRV